MADALCGAAAPILPTGAAACPVTDAQRHYCSRCGHSGEYTGTGPHACPGCEKLLVVEPGAAPAARAGDPAAAAAPVAPAVTAEPLRTAQDCGDRVRFELHPVLAGLSLLANTVRVLRAVSDHASLSESFSDALTDACSTWCDPFDHSGEASAEAVVSDLARYAADLCAEILVMDLNGGAA